MSVPAGGIVVLCSSQRLYHRCNTIENVAGCWVVDRIRLLEALQDIGEVVLVFGSDFAKPLPQLSLRGDGCLEVLLGHSWHILLILLRGHLFWIVEFYDIYHCLANVVEGFRALHPRRSKRSLEVFESTRIFRVDHPVNGLSRYENRC